MIARRWHGIVPHEKADAYRKLMIEVAIPDYQSITGNRGAWCLTREYGALVHFEMLTFWDSFDAIQAFAGPDFERAKYYDFDEAFLVELEPHVMHFEVSSDHAVGQNADARQGREK